MSFEGQKPKKIDFDVVSRFLEILDIPDRQFTKTKLQMAVNVNTIVSSKYIEWLVAKGYVVMMMDGGFTLIKITKAGTGALEMLNRLTCGVRKNNPLI